MRLNEKGFVIEGAALAIICVMALFILPQNPLSSALGVGVRPNKTIQTEKVELIKDNQGVPIAYRTTTSDREIQQHVTFWEWLRSLPVLVIVLMILGIIFPPISLFLRNLYSNLKYDTKKIVVGVDKALDSIEDQEIKQKFLDKMDGEQDQSTKELVDKIQGKT